ncbi:hypothetical protein EAF00_002370 [Botryotinia globosa]|nr:hypothetical protein EAF00_002370 [Botryotinia globosa]
MEIKRRCEEINSICTYIYTRDEGASTCLTRHAAFQVPCDLPEEIETLGAREEKEYSSLSCLKGTCMQNREPKSCCERASGQLKYVEEKNKKDPLRPLEAHACACGSVSGIVFPPHRFLMKILTLAFSLSLGIILNLSVINFTSQLAYFALQHCKTQGSSSASSST